jgi:glutamyl-tRNA reductase
MSDPSPTFFVVGATHHTAPLELRERLALDPARLEEFRQALAAIDGLPEHAVLNTCNRVEFYGVARDPAALTALQDTFCAFQGLPSGAFAGICDQASGPAAIHHLIEVAAGLDSQLIGENEIFGQVKDAYAAALAAGSAGPVLHRVFQKTFQAAKTVRSSTGITTGQVSVANVAVELALTIFGELTEARVLLLGAGEIGEKTARAFLSRGAGTLTVSSRTLGRAMELATALDATALPFENFPAHLADFDVVVCSTAAPHAIITREELAPAMRRRPARPLFCIDLALPRDIDPAVTRLQNVYLYNLDDLARIARENLATRTAELGKARAIAAERAATLWRQIRDRCPGGDTGTTPSS